MLNEGTVYATIAVKNMDEAKQFYGETLELKQIDENPGGVTYQSGTGQLFIYEAPTAGTNQATSASWDVADIAATVENLKSKGISFEHFDMPGPDTEWQADIMVMGPMKAAWFKDPSGNTLMLGGTSGETA